MNIEIYVGGVLIDPVGVFDITLYTSVRRLPYGSISYDDIGGKTVEGSLIPGGAYINIACEDMGESVVFSGYVVNQTIKPMYNGSYRVNLEFIAANNSTRHLKLIKPNRIMDKVSSIAAIKELCDRSGVEMVMPEKIATSDSMRWVTNNKNLVNAVSSISSRSYISGNDALITCFNTIASLAVTSLKTSMSDPVCTMKHVRNSEAGIAPDLDFKAFSDYEYINASGARMGVFDGNLVRLIPTYYNKKKNSVDTDKDGMFFLKAPILANGKQVLGKSSVFNNLSQDPQSNSVFGSISETKCGPNTHDKYGESSIIRQALFGSMCHIINTAGPLDSTTSAGLSVNMEMPSELSMVDQTKIPASSLSGVYFITDKVYQYSKQYSKMIQYLTMASDSVMVDKKIQNKIQGAIN